MGKRASRVGRDNAQGLILGPGARTVLINNAPASLVRDRIAPHGQAPHSSSIVLTGSRTVFAESRALTVQTSTTVCGHLVSSGSDNVFADDPGGSGSGGGGGRGLNIPLRDTTNVFDGVFIPPDPYTFEHARAVITAAGQDAIADEEIETSFRESAIADFPPETQPDLDPEADTDDDTPAPAPPSDIPGCEDITAPPVDYTAALSASYVVRNLSTGAVFPHRIVAQLGLTEDEIICNLRALAENILEPLRSQYPGFNINSGFRQNTSGSQHNRGQAVDVQWPGLPAGDYTERALWIRDNLPYDQFILEHGRSIWFHLSFNRDLGSSQRRQVLTYHPQTSPQYQPGITNYYA